MPPRDPRWDPKPGDCLILNGRRWLVLNLSADGQTVAYTIDEAGMRPLGRLMTLERWRAEMAAAQLA